MAVQYAGWEQTALQSALNRRTLLYCTESDDPSCCDNTIWPPEDEHDTARNMSRIISPTNFNEQFS